MNKNIDSNDIISQVMKNKNKKFWEISLTHASGPGGQHINHGNSKAQLVFDIDKFLEIFDLSEEKKEKFKQVCGVSKIRNSNSTLILENQETRYASRNKQKLLENLQVLLLEILKEEEPRIETKIPKWIKEKRLNLKKQHSQKKKNRSKDDWKD